MGFTWLVAHFAFLPAGAITLKGIGRNFPIDVLHGWRVWYNQPYSHATQESHVSPTSGDCMLLGSIKPTQPHLFSLVGFGTRSAILNTGFGKVDGIFWYKFSGATGFSLSGHISIGGLGADNYNLSDPFKLSWHLGGEHGGWRSGTTINMNHDSSWRKVVMTGPCFLTTSTMASTRRTTLTTTRTTTTKTMTTKTTMTLTTTKTTTSSSSSLSSSSSSSSSTSSSSSRSTTAVFDYLGPTTSETSTTTMSTTSRTRTTSSSSETSPSTGSPSTTPAALSSTTGITGPFCSATEMRCPLPPLYADQWYGVLGSENDTACQSRGSPAHVSFALGACNTSRVNDWARGLSRRVATLLPLVRKSQQLLFFKDAAPLLICSCESRIEASASGAVLVEAPGRLKVLPVGSFDFQATLGIFSDASYEVPATDALVSPARFYVEVRSQDPTTRLSLGNCTFSPTSEVELYSVAVLRASCPQPGRLGKSYRRHASSGNTWRWSVEAFKFASYSSLFLVCSASQCETGEDCGLCRERRLSAALQIPDVVAAPPRGLREAGTLQAQLSPLGVKAIYPAPVPSENWLLLWNRTAEPALRVNLTVFGCRHFAGKVFLQTLQGSLSESLSLELRADRIFGLRSQQPMDELEALRVELALPDLEPASLEGVKRLMDEVAGSELLSNMLSLKFRLQGLGGMELVQTEFGPLQAEAWAEAPSASAGGAAVAGFSTTGTTRTSMSTASTSAAALVWGAATGSPATSSPTTTSEPGQGGLVELQLQSSSPAPGRLGATGGAPWFPSPQMLAACGLVFLLLAASLIAWGCCRRQGASQAPRQSSKDCAPAQSTQEPDAPPALVPIVEDHAEDLENQDAAEHPPVQPTTLGHRLKASL